MSDQTEPQIVALLWPTFLSSLTAAERTTQRQNAARFHFINGLSVEQARAKVIEDWQAANRRAGE